MSDAVKNDAPAPLPAPPGFATALAGLGIELEPSEVERLGCFLALLLDANRRFNLTAIHDPEAAWERHVLDSLTLLPLLVRRRVQRILDVGSGGGLPGIPLAITMPSASVALLEATGKKARFLEDTARALALENVTVLAGRAEVLGHDRERHRERFDAVVARAVGPLPTLLEWTSPFVEVGGAILATKGAKAVEEIRAAAHALEILRLEVTATERTPTGTIVIIEKRGPTPKAYPRRQAEAKYRPL